MTLTIERTDNDVKVLAYPSSLRRALTNVITNAEQFSAEGEEVHVRLSRKGAHGIVDVMDRGPGVPAEQRRTIFEMFETARPGGTGLGLFLAKAAVERCGGGIEVFDRPDGGAWFQISLPLVHERN